MRVYLTGGHGFVAQWLRRHLEAEGDQVVGSGAEVDVTDPAAIKEAVVAARPDAIYHLAAFTHVGRSWDDPVQVFTVNATGTVNVLQAARACPGPPRVLLVGSAEAYGPVKADQLPLTEDSPLMPVTPYALGKVAAEFAGIQAHLGYQLPVIRVRPFNHVGPGQSPDFVLSALAQRLVEAERTGAPSITVGNLAARRDFTDVRDVVRAYRLLVCGGQAGAVYNVCSGRDLSIAELADELVRLSGRGVALVPDPELTRPVDIPVLRGDPRRLHLATGWEPTVPLEQTLLDVLEAWRVAP
ncbi:MAG TPA: GDP-mannose 4,6-dehydratase [Acidimicrobiales bacterium]